MHFLIVLTLFGAAVAVPSNPQRIVGGNPTTVEEYPYIANMQFSWWGTFWNQACGGSLITTRAVLSAAHCYNRDAPSSWRVRLGTSLIASGGTDHIISKLALHPNFDLSTYDNDVAIVHMTTPAVLSATIGLARIAGPNYVLPDGTQVTAVGWGTQSYNGFSVEQLQHVNINLINQELCAARYAYLKTHTSFSDWPDVTEGMICAGLVDVGGADSCQGDNGGPLVHNDVIVGVISWRYNCADAFYPGVNARVSKYTTWIVEEAEGF